MSSETIPVSSDTPMEPSAPPLDSSTTDPAVLGRIKDTPMGPSAPPLETMISPPPLESPPTSLIPDQQKLQQDLKNKFNQFAQLMSELRSQIPRNQLVGVPFQPPQRLPNVPTVAPPLVQPPPQQTDNQTEKLLDDLFGKVETAIQKLIDQVNTSPMFGGGPKKPRTKKTTTTKKKIVRKYKAKAKAKAKATSKTTPKKKKV